LKANGLRTILLIMILVAILIFLNNCGGDEENDDKVLKPKNAYSVACHAASVALKGNTAAMMELLDERPVPKAADSQKNLFAVMDFIRDANPRNLSWGGISRVKIDREQDKKTHEGLICFHGTFTYSGPVQGTTWWMADNAPGTVKTCVRKAGKAYVTEKLEFDVRDVTERVVRPEGEKRP